jgi:hypothetical protein
VISVKCNSWLTRNFNALYFSPNITRVINERRIEMGREGSTYGEEGRCMQGFGGKT